MAHPKFPRGEDDAFFFGDLRQPNYMDEIWLAAAQRYLSVGWRFQYVMPTGRMDAQTSAAICQVQREIGHNPDGRLDKQTWDAIFMRGK